VVTDVRANEELWRLLWSQTAKQIIDRLPRDAKFELVNAGLGWGLSRQDNSRSALLLYPSGEGRSAGDLSLLIKGKGTQTIPRYGHSYPDYLAEVEDVVMTVAENYLFTTN
jgi:hypothetical protein